MDADELVVTYHTIADLNKPRDLAAFFKKHGKDIMEALGELVDKVDDLEVEVGDLQNEVDCLKDSLNELEDDIIDNDRDREPLYSGYGYGACGSYDD